MAEWIWPAGMNFDGGQGRNQLLPPHNKIALSGMGNTAVAAW
jgi:hypothetical protein